MPHVTCEVPLRAGPDRDNKFLALIEIAAANRRGSLGQLGAANPVVDAVGEAGAVGDGDCLGVARVGVGDSFGVAADATEIDLLVMRMTHRLMESGFQLLILAWLMCRANLLPRHLE